MAESVYDLIITNGTLVTHETSEAVNIAITDGRFAALGGVSAEQGREHIDATGLTILPGVIDTQVHFREPGIEHKEDLQSGSRAAVMGGVTGVFEMPNTKPPTTTAEAVEDKVATPRCRADAGTPGTCTRTCPRCTSGRVGSRVGTAPSRSSPS